VWLEKVGQKAIWRQKYSIIEEVNKQLANTAGKSKLSIKNKIKWSNDF